MLQSRIVQNEHYHFFTITKTRILINFYGHNRIYTRMIQSLISSQDITKNKKTKNKKTMHLAVFCSHASSQRECIIDNPHLAHAQSKAREGTNENKCMHLNLLKTARNEPPNQKTKKERRYICTLAIAIHTATNAFNL